MKELYMKQVRSNFTFRQDNKKYNVNYLPNVKMKRKKTSIKIFKYFWFYYYNDKSSCTQSTTEMYSVRDPEGYY
jgi:hypothetical protein